MKNKLSVLIGCVLLALAFPAGVQAQFAPDLTTTDLATINRTQTYNLGPTGMRGWIFLTNWNNNIGDFGVSHAVYATIPFRHGQWRVPYQAIPWSDRRSNLRVYRN